MNNFLRIVLILSIVSAGAFNNVFAGIGANPPLVEISAPAGETVSGELSVYNDGDADLTIKGQPEYFFRPPKTDNNKDLDINSWLTVEPAEFLLKSGEMKKVNYSVNLPEGFKGEILAQIYFSQADDLHEKAVGTTVKTRFGVGLYVAAKGSEVVKATITGIDVSRNDEEIKYAVEIENLGNVHLRPRGKIIIEDLKGNEIQRLETQYGWPVFPHGKCVYNTKWHNFNLAAGKYKARAVVEYVNPYDQKNGGRLEDQVMFTISEDGHVTMAKAKGKENAPQL
jgi:hypothetical protein